MCAYVGTDDINKNLWFFPAVTLGVWLSFLKHSELPKEIFTDDMTGCCRGSWGGAAGRRGRRAWASALGRKLGGCVGENTVRSLCPSLKCSIKKKMPVQHGSVGGSREFAGSVPGQDTCQVVGLTPGRGTHGGNRLTFLLHWCFPLPPPLSGISEKHPQVRTRKTRMPVSATPRLWTRNSPLS